MDENEGTDAARSNLAAVERRSLKLHVDANSIRDDATLPYGVRQNANTASMVSAVAWLMAQSGRAANAGAGLAAAERAYDEARVGALRPAAEFGAAFLAKKDTTAAKAAHIAKATARHSVVIGFVLRILAADKTGSYRHAGGAKAGTPNAAKLAKFYVGLQTANAPLGERSVREIIKKAVLDKRLA